MANAVYTKPGTYQRGATLIISLLFLIILTLIGLSSLNSSKLEQRMAHNYQLTSYVFQGAESAIENVLITGTADTQINPGYDPTTDILVNAASGSIGNTVTDNTYDPDPQGYLGSVSMTTSSSTVYQGQETCPETSFGEVICFKFEVTSTASIAGTGATDTHRVGILRQAPGG